MIPGVQTREPVPTLFGSRPAITDYKPRHRRAIRWADSTPLARCTDSRNAFDGGCIELCPLHDPDEYAEHMARHATDTIGPLSGRAPRGEW